MVPVDFDIVREFVTRAARPRCLTIGASGTKLMVSHRVEQFKNCNK